jgi:hypothetical protein
MPWLSCFLFSAYMELMFTYVELAPVARTSMTHHLKLASASFDVAWSTECNRCDNFMRKLQLFYSLHLSRGI